MIILETSFTEHLLFYSITGGGNAEWIKIKSKKYLDKVAIRIQNYARSLYSISASNWIYLIQGLSALLNKLNRCKAAAFSNSY